MPSPALMTMIGGCPLPVGFRLPHFGVPLYALRVEGWGKRVKVTQISTEKDKKCYKTS